MATLQQKRSENVDGDFYVDSTCIDCDTCRWVAPDIFNRQSSMSAVYYQPQTESERVSAMQALLSCPTASIGTVEKPKDVKQVQKTFPIQIEDDVYYCGYHSESSFGAASYFIKRPDGNILIDSPRFTPPLVKQLEKLGGIEYLYLTHQDDVADHQKYHDHFNGQRILHLDDIKPATKEVEIKLSGTETVELTPDISIIPVPGHTKGHTVLLYKNKFLFTGDHLAWSPHYEHLYAFARFCWYDWSEQIKSMEKLANYSFEWVLPGHGRRYHGDLTTTKKQMEQCISWMKEQ
ncbi:MBL fold metallo-hydrolase [Waterburya agarophytonicola K14]|uniref:MBL fold metallo-hydrolase n=1 Tax=Waterburya agarophytonicola KI4 TaxID=2874699 RepID=A0A964BNK8_9CYAN|nr:MBL fold metallo-hydrolase [Waterburya agarophytonicola]MCC0176733.1 MBL fold metallo-hydrolase [Waterburya agarophytonicola KI4]